MPEDALEVGKIGKITAKIYKKIKLKKDKAEDGFQVFWAQDIIKRQKGAVDLYFRDSFENASALSKDSLKKEEQKKDNKKHQSSEEWVPSS